MIRRPTLLVALLAAACAGVPEEVPAVDLTGVEAPIADAVRDARRAVGRSLQSADAWGALADRYRAHGWLEAAAVCYGRAAALDPGNPVWVYRRGRALLLLKRPAESAEALRVFLTARPGYAPGQVALASALVEAGDAEGARAALERARRFDPNDTHALLGLGQLALQARDFQAARRYLEAGLERGENHGELHLALAQACMALGDAACAGAHAARSRGLPKHTPARDPLITLDLPPVGSQALNEQGSRLAAAGRAQEAERHFRAALEIKPQYAEARYNLGTLLARSGRRDEALQQLVAAVEARPSHADARANLGLLLGELGRLGEARPQLEAALAVNPDHLAAHVGLGGVLRRQGQFHGAARHYEAALRLRPRHAESSCWLSWILATAVDPSLRDGPRAVELAQAAAAATNLDAAVPLDVLAAAYAEAGRFDDAQLFARRAIDTARSAGETALVPLIEERLRGYAEGRPHREGTPPRT